MKILLGQLGANGDCLYATTLARQIKHDFPESQLTWAISQQCAHLLDNNPDVDDIWVWPITDWAGHISAWHALERSVLRNQQSIEPFEKIYLSQIVPGNLRHYDGTVRPSIFRAYPNKISVPIDSVIRLADSEQQRVEEFVAAHKIKAYEHVFLFECSSKSGQSKVTPEYALEVAKGVAQHSANTLFVLSTHETIDSDLDNVVSAKSLSMRENAALTHYCSMFLGCGSGLTVVATSSAAKPIPNVQILDAKKSVYASFFHDFQFFGLSTERFIEIGDGDPQKIIDVIVSFIESGLDETRVSFHQPIPVHFRDYIDRIEKWAIRQGKYMDALESLMHTVDRYGWCDELWRFGKSRVAKIADRDPIRLNERLNPNVQAFLESIRLGTP